jgi:RNA polymerase sigma factor (sigma-70 family)
MTDDAFGAALEQHIPALRRYAFALLREHEGADDLVQDCLERALSRWRLRRPDGDLRAWLFTILRNLYINSYNTRRRRGTPLPLDAIPPPTSAPAQERGLDLHDVLTALDHLPEEQKSLLLLIGVEDLSYDDAARVLGVPVGTIMSRLSRGRQRLRAVMETGRSTLLRRVK